MYNYFVIKIVLIIIVFKNWKCVVFEEVDFILDGVEVIVNFLCGFVSI